MPLRIETTEHFTRRQMRNHILVFGCFIGILALITFNAIFFLITGEKAFIWLSLAEFFFGFQALRTSGHFTYFFFIVNENYIHNRNFNELAGTFVKTMFIVFIILFAKSFIKTKKNYPIFNKFLSFIAVSAMLLFCIQALDTIQGKDVNVILFKTNWLLVLFTAIALPIVAIRATIDISINFWPLIVAWVVFAIFVFYGVALTLNLFPSLPISTHFIGPIGLFETVFATLALALHVRQMEKDKTTSQLRLENALEANVLENKKSKNLAEDKAEAISIITDQSMLIHASGHDSKQVIAALNSAILMLEQSNNKKDQETLKDIIESSTNYLKQIVSSTLSGANMTIVNSDFTALSKFSSEDLFLPLEMLYRKQARNNGIALQFSYFEDDYLISDLPILSRCLSNFLSNSLKFTENGQVIINGVKEDNTYKITFEDTGTGLTHNMLTHLNAKKTNRIKQTEEKEGSGSGYLHAASLIHSLGGHVKIANRQGSGATVTIRLPLSETLSPCNLDRLRTTLHDYEIIDINAEPNILESIYPRTKRIAVTYDDSPIMREKLSKNYRFVFYKPLCLELSYLMETMGTSNQIEFDSPR